MNIFTIYCYLYAKDIKLIQYVLIFIIIYIFSLIFLYIVNLWNILTIYCYLLLLINILYNIY